jgi:hypothetical protein
MVGYIGRTRKNVTHAGNGREAHLAGLPNLKVDGYCAETSKVFEYLGCFGTGVQVRPIGINPFVKLIKHS